MRAPGAIAGREEGVLDTGSDDLDVSGGVAIQASELALFLGAADADRIGATDDLGFGTLAQLRFEVAALGLHLGEGVKRTDEREVELVLDAMPDETAEPVVGVQHVGGRVVLDVVDHGVAELGQHRRKLFLAEVVAAGGNMHHPMPRLDLDHLRESGSRRSRVRRALDTGLGERGNQLAHVHVHAATVARARLGQRRRVE